LIHLVPVALGSSSKDCTLRSPEGNYLDGVIACGADENEAKKEFKERGSVKVRVFDDLVLPKLSLTYMKLDVEGFEIQALEGMSKFMKTDAAPLYIRSEVNSHVLLQNGITHEKFARFFYDSGYQVLLTTHSCSSLECVTKSVNQVAPLGDVNFVRNFM
jgi:hypothetical protein